MNQLTLPDEAQVLAPMTKDEARQCVDAINNHLSEARELIYDLYTRDGWKALGYRNWTDCVENEFPMSSRNVWRELASAKIEVNLLTHASVGTVSARQLEPLASLEPNAQREVWRIAQETAPTDKDGPPRLTGAHVQRTVDQWQRTRPEPRQPISQFNRTNENIEWAAWSWNPVTGCKHCCPYCYARDIANRFYPQGFEPTFHPERLSAPQNTSMMQPRWQGDIGYKGVFVCSMADLFGKWVPQEWIDAVLDAVRQAPQWNFLFLTKNPRRLTEIQWPENTWVGATVDRQARVEETEEAFAQIDAGVLFVSCEPLLERITFQNLGLFDWLIVGGQSASSTMKAFQPEWGWVEDLLWQARNTGCGPRKVYFKTNLKSRPREYPL